MVLRLFLFAVIFLFAACTEMGERSNPDDPNGINFRGGLISNTSSQSVGGASSSSVTAGASSSSVAESSSSSQPSSSGGSTQANIVYGADVSYQGETYKTVKIGNQTWFQRNLNYNASGSKCGNNDSHHLTDANTISCSTYGKLYDWATAMALDTSCNSSSCTSQVSAKHQGICPSGWHIPSDAEWTALTNFVGSNAGTKLKSQSSDWYNGGNGTDDFGFAALPGGYGYYHPSDSYFFGVSMNGNWWSASESTADHAYYWTVVNSSEDVYFDSYDTGIYLFSVRCLKD